MIGGIAETQEMLDHCARHGMVSDVEIIPIQQINAAYERVLPATCATASSSTSPACAERSQNGSPGRQSRTRPVRT
jgi:hypothetical protein